MFTAPTSSFQVLYHLLPSCCQKKSELSVKELAQQNFKNNYYKLKARSLANGLTCYALALTSVVLICLGESPLAITATAAASIALVIIWHKWGNQPFLLLNKAKLAMAQKNEALALECIEQGADIYKKTGGELFSLNIFPLLSYNCYKIPPNTLLEMAAISGCSRIVDYLIQVGVHDEVTLNNALAYADTPEMVEKLLEGGADIQLARSRRFSILYLQLLRLFVAPKRLDGYPDGFLEKKLQAIELLLSKGATLQPHDKPKKEIIEQLDALPIQNDLTRDLIDNIRKLLDRLDQA